MYRVRVAPSGRSFAIQRVDTLLEGALRAGLAPNYGCSNGNCGLCKARVVAGDVVKTRRHDYVLTTAEKAQGYVLMCSTAAASDLAIEAGEAGAADDIPRQRIVARLRQMLPLSGRVNLLHLQTPRTQRLRFLAGQSLTLTLGDASATYAIASCPCDDRNLQFHVVRDADEFSRRLERCRPGDVVTVDGPHGTFTLAQAPPRPVVFVAGDTGFARIKSLAEHLMAIDDSHRAQLYWLAADDGHYLDNLCRSWADALDAFGYRPLTVDAGDYDAAIADIATRVDGATHEWYVAGPVALIDAVRRHLAGVVPENQLHYASPP